MIEERTKFIQSSERAIKYLILVILLKNRYPEIIVNHWKIMASLYLFLPRGPYRWKPRMYSFLGISNPDEREKLGFREFRHFVYNPLETPEEFIGRLMEELKMRYDEINLREGRKAPVILRRLAHIFSGNNDSNPLRDPINFKNKYLDKLTIKEITGEIL